MSAPKTPTVRSAWLALPFTLLGFPIAVAIAFGVYGLFDLCMEGEKALCTDPAYPYPSWYHLALIFVIGWLVIAGPSFIALRRGLAARRAGAANATPVVVVSGAILALITVVLLLAIV